MTKKTSNIVCYRCGKDFEEEENVTRVTCPHCESTFDLITFPDAKYVQPGLHHPGTDYKKSCKGLFFRCHVNDHSTIEPRNTIVCPTKLYRGAAYRLLLRQSCQDDDCGQCTQFYEDLHNTNMENFIWPKDPVDGFVYVAKFNLGKPGFEDLHEEWEWIIEGAPKEKQV